MFPHVACQHGYPKAARGFDQPSALEGTRTGSTNRPQILLLLRGDVPLIVRTGDCLLGNYVTVDSPERQTLIDRDGAGVQAVGRNGGDVAVGDSAIPSSTFAGRSNACTR